MCNFNCIKMPNHTNGYNIKYCMVRYHTFRVLLTQNRFSCEFWLTNFGNRTSIFKVMANWSCKHVHGRDLVTSRKVSNYNFININIPSSSSFSLPVFVRRLQLSDPDISYQFQHFVVSSTSITRRGVDDVMQIIGFGEPGK